MMKENMNEDIRERIRKQIVGGGMNMPPEMEHLLTSICFEMYKAGMNDAFRLAKKSIGVLEEEMKK